MKINENDQENDQKYCNFAPQSVNSISMFRSMKLIGRDNELKNLKVLVDLAINGKGHLVLIKGDPGIGKTRLVEELEKYADTIGGLFLQGKCIENCSIPFGPFKKVLIGLVEKVKHDLRWRERIKQATANTGFELIQLAPNIEDILASSLSQEKSGLGKKQDKFFQLLSNFLTSLARPKNPFILFFDDLHWTNKDTIRCLYYLVSHIRFSHILIIGTYRNQEVDEDHPLNIIINEKDMRDFPLIEIFLPPLLPINVKEIVEAMLEDKSGEIDDLSFFIFHKTGGNPFFIKELITYLKDQEIICLNDEKWEIDKEKL